MTPSGDRSIEITADMPGVIVEIKVSVGQSVQIGDELLLLESMKIESPVTSPSAAEVTEIFVQVGENVSGGQLLLLMTTNSSR